MTWSDCSIVIPAKNERISLERLMPNLLSNTGDAEIIVVDDGSTDGQNEVVLNYGVNLVVHPYSKGNGAAIKSGVRAATRKFVVFMDADGQHQPKDIERIIQVLESGYDMAVGARKSKHQASVSRALANKFYNKLASWMVGHPVLDLTSGFRGARRDKFLKFLYLLPNGFSYPTTITMAFFRAGFSVSYLDVDVRNREAGTKSHVNLWRDGFRFLLIIFKIGTLYSPLKIFVPVSAGFFLSGVWVYAYNYLMSSKFTNMSAFLFSVSVVVFLIGLVSEQVTALLFKDVEV